MIDLTAFHELCYMTRCFFPGLEPRVYIDRLTKQGYGNWVPKFWDPRNLPQGLFFLRRSRKQLLPTLSLDHMNHPLVIMAMGNPVNGRFSVAIVWSHHKMKTQLKRVGETCLRSAQLTKTKSVDRVIPSLWVIMSSWNMLELPMIQGEAPVGI